MQKFLSTCFLALLCLPLTIGIGSASTLDQVVQSPNAGHPEGSAPHRSGDSRSDYSSFADFGLVDKYQDPGAGEVNPVFLPAPVTVYDSANQTSYRFNPEYPQISNQSNSKLIDERISGLNSAFGIPVFSDKSRGKIIPTIGDSLFSLRVEVRQLADRPSPKIHIQILTQEMDSRFGLVHLQQDSLLLDQGTFMDGTFGFWQGEQHLPLSQSIARLRISFEERDLMKDFWISPGDSLRISYDPGTGTLSFLGPQADKFRFQQELHDLAYQFRQEINPTMILSSVDRILDTPEKLAQYQVVSDNYKPGWNRKMEWLTTEQARLQRSEYLIRKARTHPILKAIAEKDQQLDSGLLNWLRLYWEGKLRKEALDFITLAKGDSEEWGRLLMGFGFSAGLEEEHLGKGPLPIELVEAGYVQYILLEDAMEIPFGKLIDTLPARLREDLMAFYLIREYKNLPDAKVLLADQIKRTSEAWKRDYLTDILESNLQGSQLLNHPFLDEEGNEVYPESWKGKLVVIDFWLSGCSSCFAFAKNKFLPLLEEFAGHPDILFVTITGDDKPELWKNSLAKGIYTNSKSQNLFAGGISHPTLSQYHIQAFPAQLLLDKEGRILQSGGFPSNLEGWRTLLQTYLLQNSQP